MPGDGVGTYRGMSGELLCYYLCAQIGCLSAAKNARHPLLLRGFHNLDPGDLPVPAGADRLEDQTELSIFTGGNRRCGDGLGIDIWLVGADKGKRERLDLSGMAVSLPKTTCTVAEVRVFEPLFLMWPSINVDLPPESEVDSLIAMPEMANEAASGAGARSASADEDLAWCVATRASTTTSTTAAAMIQGVHEIGSRWTSREVKSVAGERSLEGVGRGIWGSELMREILPDGSSELVTEANVS